MLCDHVCSPSKEWLDSYLRAAQNNFFQFSPAEMSNIIWALAKIGYKVGSLLDVPCQLPTQ